MHIIRLIALCASQAAAATDKKSSPSTILAFRWSGLFGSVTREYLSPLHASTPARFHLPTRVVRQMWPVRGLYER